jgi:leucyl aminopeptidase
MKSYAAWRAHMTPVTLNNMEIKSSRQDIKDISEEVIVVPVFKSEAPRDGVLGLLDALTHGAIANVIESGELDGSDGQIVFLHRTGEMAARRLLLYGAGERESLSPAKLGRLAGAATRSVLNRGVKSIAFLARGAGRPAALAQSAVEGVMLGQMSSAIYATNGDKCELERLAIAVEGSETDGLESAIETGRIMGEATNFARQLGNEPSNVMTPAEIARRAQEMAAREGLKVEVLGGPELKQRGFGALLAVSSGSSEPPRFIVLDYCSALQDDARQETIALVGKGVTFDSGGISIKPAASMDEMKFDMCGGRGGDRRYASPRQDQAPSARTGNRTGV